MSLLYLAKNFVTNIKPLSDHLEAVAGQGGSEKLLFTVFIGLGSPLTGL